MKDRKNSVELQSDVVNSINEATNEGVCKKSYVKPQLSCFGDVRDVTLGGSIPGGESLGGCIIGFEIGCNP